MSKIVSVTKLREKTVKVLSEALEEPLCIVVRSKPKVIMESVDIYSKREAELSELRKKVFEYETLQALKEVRAGKGKSFKSAKALISSLKSE